MWHTYRPLCGPIWPETAATGDPVLSLIGDKQATVGQALTFTVAATDSDSDTLTYSATGLPTGATFTNQVFTWTPGTAAAGTYQVTFTVSDGSAQDSETITITVDSAQCRPRSGRHRHKTTSENQALSFSVSATDTDGDPITYSATGLPSGASFTGQDLHLDARLQPGRHLQRDLHGRRRQGPGLRDHHHLGGQRQPVARPWPAIGDRSVDEDNTLTLALSAADPDGTGLTYSATGLPAGANLSRKELHLDAHSRPGRLARDHVRRQRRHAHRFRNGRRHGRERRGGSSGSRRGQAVAGPGRHPGVVEQPDHAPRDRRRQGRERRVRDELRWTARSSTRATRPLYTSAYGRCTRSGVKNDYQFIYQNSSMFDVRS